MGSCLHKNNIIPLIEEELESSFRAPISVISKNPKLFITLIEKEPILLPALVPLIVKEPSLYAITKEGGFITSITNDTKKR